ncbi:MAG: hydrolase [Thermococcus sp.]|uniref:hydrolase n=1 Tax=Thermococcus sp. TaxID=35749 RepID=UPI001D46B137|nr:hydrolase [Thermococcus sp.]MBO8175117.1 hydrolase [Thermococcus sp.]
MRRKGFIFTLDALLSLLLIMIFVSSVAIIGNNIQTYPTYMREQDKYIAEDTLTVLRTVSLKELVPPQKIEEWLADGTLNTTLVSPDMSPIEIVSTYWATEPLYPSANLRHKAEIILGYILNRTLKGYNYELMINNYTSPYLRKVGSNSSKVPNISPATLILSGYAYNQTPRGYMARAFLTKLGSKENTYTIRGGYIYARTDSSDQKVIIKYIVPAGDIPSDAQIEEIDWFLEPAWVGSQYEVYLNGQLIWSGYVNNNYLLTDSDPSGGLQLIENFVPGQENVFEVRVYKSGYDGGEDGAQYIRIKYTTSTPSTLKFPKRFYFEDVSANYGITAWKYLFVPGILKSLNIQIAVGNVSSDTPITLSFMFDREVTISATRCEYDPITSIKTCYWDNSTIANTLNSEGYNYTQISSRYTTVIVRAGNQNTYYSRIHLIRENSFIEADYLSGVLATPYTIDITEPIPLPNLDWTDYVNIQFDVPSGVIPLWVKFQFPWLYYVGYDPYQKIEIDNDVITPTYIHCHGDGCNPSSPFMYALARVGYTKDTFDWKYDPLPNAISSGTNTITISLGYGYWLQPMNGDGELTYVIQAYAGYGDVFPKLIRSGCSGYNITYYWSGDNTPHYVTAGEPPYCAVTAEDLVDGRDTYAVDDAIIRLFNKLGGNGTQTNPILIELPPTVNIEFASMGDIPGLFKPITITLRVWREQ